LHPPRTKNRTSQKAKTHGGQLDAAQDAAALTRHRQQRI
jgi:hypothetical protein